MQPAEPLERGFSGEGHGRHIIACTELYELLVCPGQVPGCECPIAAATSVPNSKEHSQTYVVSVCAELSLLSAMKDWTEIHLPWNFQLEPSLSLRVCPLTTQQAGKWGWGVFAL